MKKTVVLILALVMVLGIVGCGGSAKEPEPTEKPESMPNVEITQNETNIEPTETPVSEMTTGSPHIETVIQDGDTIEKENIFSFTVNGWSHADEIKKEMFSSGIMQIPGNDNVVMVWLDLSYINQTAETQVDKEVLDYATLLYKNKYTYEGEIYAFTDFVSGGRSLMPLTNSPVYIAFKVPPVIFEDNEPLEMTFSLCGEQFEYTLR